CWADCEAIARIDNTTNRSQVGIILSSERLRGVAVLDIANVGRNLRVDEEPAIQICGISADERALKIDLRGRALEVLVRVDVPGHHAEEPTPAPIPRQEPRGEVHATNDPEAVLIVLNFVPEVAIVQREAVILRPLGPVAECLGPHTGTNTWRA